MAEQDFVAILLRQKCMARNSTIEELVPPLRSQLMKRLLASSDLEPGLGTLQAFECAARALLNSVYDTLSQKIAEDLADVLCSSPEDCFYDGRSLADLVRSTSSTSASLQIPMLPAPGHLAGMH